MKKSLILLAVAAVVCLLVFADYARKSPSETGAESSTGRVMQIQAFQGVSPDTVARIEIVPPGKKEPIVLEKDASEWKVKDGELLYRLAEYKKDRLFGVLPGKEKKPALEGPLTLDLQARNPKNHADFDLTADKATDVKFYDDNGKLLTDVLIGKSGSVYESTYVRFPNKDEVYLAPIRLSDNFAGADVDAWRDKRLFPGIKYDDVYKIHVDDRSNTRTFTIAKRTGSSGVAAKWWVTEPYTAPARASTADSMARTLVSCNAVDFVNPEDVSNAGFDHPTAIARFDVKDDPTTLVLTVGAESATDKGRFYAKTNLSDQVYMIYKPYALNVAPETLKETPTPTPSPSPTATPVPTETTAGETSPGESSSSGGSPSTGEGAAAAAPAGSPADAGAPSALSPAAAPLMLQPPSGSPGASQPPSAIQSGSSPAPELISPSSLQPPAPTPTQAGQSK